MCGRIGKERGDLTSPRGSYFTNKYGEKGEKGKKQFQDRRQSTNDICRKFNTNECLQQKDKECKTSWGKHSNTSATSTWQGARFAERIIQERTIEKVACPSYDV
jgi:hypothetical protein